MTTAVPAIACIGIIGRNNNPLHTTIFPTSTSATNPQVRQPLRTPLQYSLILSSTLDVFESRARHATASNTLLSGDFGLLHAVDERLACYGFETNTGVKIVAVVDMRGRVLDRAGASGGISGSGSGKGASSSSSSASAAAAAAAALGAGGGVGLRDGELKVVFRAVQTAYVRLLQNPFYEPDVAGANGFGQKRITSRKFAEEMRRIGEVWVPGSVSAL